MSIQVKTEVISIQTSSVPKISIEIRKEKRKRGCGIILTCLLTMSILWTLYGNIATFYPPFRKEHHPSITDTMVGIVLSTYEIGILISSPLVSITLQRVGRKNFVIIGTLSCALASIGFGLSVYIENDIAFFILSLAMRFIAGFGDAAASTAMMSIISFEYPERREKYYSYFEGAVGVGQMIGPVIGQILYN